MLTLTNKVLAPETYIQLPGKKPPSEIYGGTWRAIYDEDSVFFRTPGFLSGPMDGSIQGDATRNVTGQIWGGSANASSGLALNGSGVFRSAGAGYGDKIDLNPDVPMDSTSIIFDLSLQVPTAIEVRPRNITVRLWEKVVENAVISQ